MTRAGVTTAVLALVLSLACGCAGLPTVRYYVLESPPAAVRPTVAPTSPGIRIAVEPFRVDAPYDQDRIVYRVGAHSPEVGFYAAHRWAAPLSQMLPRVVADGLAGAVEPGRIEPRMPGRVYDAFLEGRVRTLEEVDTLEGEGVRIRIELSLYGSDGSPLWAYVLEGGATIDTEQVFELVQQMKQVLDQGLREASEGLARGVPGR